MIWSRSILPLSFFLALACSGCPGGTPPAGKGYHVFLNGQKQLAYATDISDEPVKLDQPFQLDPDITLDLIRSVDAGRVFLQTMERGAWLYDFNATKLTQLNNLPASRVWQAPGTGNPPPRRVNDMKAAWHIFRGSEKNKSIPARLDDPALMAINDHDLITSPDGGNTWSLFEKTKGPGKGKYEISKRNTYLSFLWVKFYDQKPPATSSKAQPKMAPEAKKTAQPGKQATAEQLPKPATEWMLVGTAYNGLYLSESGGKYWRKINRGLPGVPHNKRVFFYEGIRSLEFDPGTKAVILGTEFGRGIYYTTKEKNFRFTALPLPADWEKDKCSAWQLNSACGKLTVSSDCGVYAAKTAQLIKAAGSETSGEKNGLWQKLKILPGETKQKLPASYFQAFAKNPPDYLEKAKKAKGGEKQKTTQNKQDNAVMALYYANPKTGEFYSYIHPDQFRAPKKMIKNAAANECRGFYISPTTTKKKLWLVRKLLNKKKKDGSPKFNCAVIDLKDDFGYVPAEIETEKTVAYKSRKSWWKLAPVLKELHERKIHTIARIVTFKDKRLHYAKNNAFALKDKYTGKAWVGTEHERWVDAYNEDVWKYNVEIALKAQEIGFKEIQFDYIRFPSDGPIHRIKTPAKTDGKYRSEALASFLKFANSKIDAPISIDIYGYHALYYIGNPIGQNMQVLGEYVDFISPMVYSSHFGNRYLSGGPYKKRAYNLLYHCTYRANTMARGRFYIRNWLQAFRMKTGLWGYGSYYFDGQTQGSLDGGSRGWLWWGPIKEFDLL